MPSLTFAASLSKDQDVPMEDAPPPYTELPAIEVTPPIDFDFSFDFDNLGSPSSSDVEPSSDSDDLELRSPRTPTYKGDHDNNSEPLSPFDADKYLSFPLLELSNEPSPLAALSKSVAAKSHVNINLPCIDTLPDQMLDLPSPPQSPLLWIWTCHLCRSRYPLGATRRCLIDGHYYCSGDVNSATVQRNVKKKKRGQACSSEFDYIGWQEWGSWRKEVAGLRRRNVEGCRACDYPSECRYRRINKIPDVVASVSKNLHYEKEETERSVGNPKVDVKKPDTKAEKKQSLKVNTGSPSLRRRRNKDRQGGTGSAAAASSGPDESSSPLSPDLVDFSALITTPENQHVEIKNHRDCDNSKAITDSTCSADSANPSDTTSRRRRGSGVKLDSKQSRISDFFGLKG